MLKIVLSAVDSWNSKAAFVPSTIDHSMYTFKHGCLKPVHSTASTHLRAWHLVTLPMLCIYQLEQHPGRGEQLQCSISLVVQHGPFNITTYILIHCMWSNNEHKYLADFPRLSLCHIAHRKEGLSSHTSLLMPVIGPCRLQVLHTWIINLHTEVCCVRDFIAALTPIAPWRLLLCDIYSSK